MDRICKKCGRKIKTEGSVCEHCGTAQSEPMKNKRLLAIIAAIVIIAAVGTLITLKFTVFRDDSDSSSVSVEENTYRTPIENFFKAYMTGDHTYLKNAYPDFDLDQMGYNESNFEEQWKENLSGIKYTSYDIGDAEKISDEDLKNMEKYVMENYDEEITIEEGYEVNVSYTCQINDTDNEETVNDEETANDEEAADDDESEESGDNADSADSMTAEEVKEEKQNQSVRVYKIDGKWYLI